MRYPNEPALTASEERILRSTINDPQIFEVPVRTVKKLLALLDVERGQVKLPVATPVPELEFITHSAHETFFMRTTRNAETVEGIFTRAEAAALFRNDLIDRIYNVPSGTTAGVVTRPGSEIADMLERGDLP